LKALLAVQPKISVTLTGSQGSLEVDRGSWHGPASGYRLSTKLPAESAQDSGKANIEAQDYPFEGVRLEMQHFHDLIRSGNPQTGGSQSLGHPVQAFSDIALVTALIEAGESGKMVRVVDL
jgi:predicted dehydrogenase